jgi:hypothetical protein
MIISQLLVIGGDALYHNVRHSVMIGVLTKSTFADEIDKFYTLIFAAFV